MSDTPAHTAQGRPERRLTGRMVALIFCGFFAIVFTMNAIMVRFALTTFGGLEVASSYEAGRAFNAERADAQRQDRLGWRVQGDIARQDAGALVRISVKDRDGAPLTGAAIEAVLQRPTARRNDVALQLREATPGTYETRLDALASGQWDLVLQITSATNETFRSRNRVMLAEGTVR